MQPASPHASKCSFAGHNEVPHEQPAVVTNRGKAVHTLLGAACVATESAQLLPGAWIAFLAQPDTIYH